MKKLTHLTLMLCAFSLIFPSCVSKKKWEEMVSQKTGLENTLADTRTQVSNLETDLNTLKEENTQLEEDYAIDKKQLGEKIGKIESDLNMVKKEKEELAVNLKTSEVKMAEISEKLKAPFSPFTAKGFSMAPEGDMLYLKGLESIRYKSGSARLAKESKEVLKSLAEVLANNPTMFLLVEGHTDNVPMKADASYASNEQLSLARAKAVVRFLVKQGASANQLTAAGHGSSKPKMAYAEEGANEEAQQMNRRAEIVVMTSPTNIYNLSQTL